MSDAQVKKLMEEMIKHGQRGQAAMKADMDRKTARKYVAAGKPPSELKQPRDWQMRPDSFEKHWPEIEARLRETPERVVERAQAVDLLDVLVHLYFTSSNFDFTAL